MATPRQILGELGERLVTKNCACPRCKRTQSLVRLPNNFKCADVICDFCGYLAQVKAATVSDVSKLPKKILGAAWGPQKERMDSGIYFPLYLVLIAKDRRKSSIFYLSADLQPAELFEARKPLSERARRKGWRGFLYNLAKVEGRLVRLI